MPGRSVLCPVLRCAVLGPLDARFGSWAGWARWGECSKACLTDINIHSDFILFLHIIFLFIFIYLLMTVWRQSCGGGGRRRTRQCEAPRADGEGTEPCGLCPGEAEQTGPCNDYQAPNTVNLC